MKTRLLIIVIMIISITLSVTLTYFHYQMTVCQLTPSFIHDSKMNGILDCLMFLAYPNPNEPNLSPSITYDVTFANLAMLETMVIAGIASSIIIVITWRKRK